MKYKIKTPDFKFTTNHFGLAYSVMGLLSKRQEETQVIKEVKEKVEVPQKSQTRKYTKKRKEQHQAYWTEQEIEYLSNNLNRTPTYLSRKQELKRHTKYGIIVMKSHLNKYVATGNKKAISKRVYQMIRK